jgi:hypothetical protein
MGSIDYQSEITSVFVTYCPSSLATSNLPLNITFKVYIEKEKQ